MKSGDIYINKHRRGPDVIVISVLENKVVYETIPRRERLAAHLVNFLRHRVLAADSTPSS